LTRVNNMAHLNFMKSMAARAEGNAKMPAGTMRETAETLWWSSAKEPSSRFSHNFMQIRYFLAIFARHKLNVKE